MKSSTTTPAHPTTTPRQPRLPSRQTILGFALPVEHKAALESQARRQGLSVSQLMRDVVKQVLPLDRED
jgi:Ribbon-helix-helix protein, copG family